MAAKRNAEYFENIVTEIINSEDSQKKSFLRVFNLIKRLIGTIVDEEERYFPSFFAKLIYVQKKLNLNEDQKNQLGNINRFAKLLSKNPGLSCITDDVNFALKVFSNLFIIYFEREISNDISAKINYESKLISLKNYERAAKGDHISGTYLIKEKINVDNENNYADVLAVDDNSKELVLRFSGKWFESINFLWKGAEIYLKNAIYDSTNNRLTFRKETFFTLEPKHFFDVSEIAECFNSNGYNPYLYFLNRYFEIDKYYHLMFGNIINQLFDELIVSDEVDFNTAFESALKSKPLNSIAVVREIKSDISGMKHKAAVQFESLRKIIPQFKKYHTSVEPSFVSDEYGIRGRLDLFLEDKENDLKKTIVELKSGSAPGKKLYYTDDDKKRITTGIWHNHFIQVTCYNMLIDSVFDQRTGDSCILYSSTDEFPLRDAPNITHKQHEALQLRNLLAAYSKNIRTGNYNLFNNFTLKDFGNRAPFVEKKIIEFSKFYNGCSELEKKYFHYFNSFIENELYQNNVGDDTDPDRVVKISENLREKSESADSFTGLKLIKEVSDLENFHLIFRINEKESEIKSIRKGDIVVLYSQFDEETAFAGKNQLFKCAVRELSNSEIKVTLRNKMINKELFTEDKLWIIETDRSDNLIKAMFSQIFAFLTNENDKKELIFGKKVPEFHEIKEIEYHGLTDQQNKIISKAVAAKDYFLIQGPPGTGKTSFVLKYIAKYLHDNSNENVIFMTYTNRAADEICRALLSIDEVPEILRLGNKESSEHQEILLSKMLEDNDMNEIYRKVNDTRFFVCTTAFLLQNPEIFLIKDFKTAILDEASQILEPQIVGILSKVDRFIMIGDEKQLPAVVTQQRNIEKLITDDLKEIGIAPNVNSLFERLLKMSRNNGFDSFAMLTKQARMHDEIQNLANNIFYDDKLVSLGLNWQNDDSFIFDKDSENKLELNLARSRVVFVNSNYEPNRKHNQSEAELTARIVQLIDLKMKENSMDYSIGVISPFRAQGSLIRNLLQDITEQKITVDTVERFQGSERDIIIISTGLNYPMMLKSIESVVNIEGRIIDRKLNVAITRAKQQLIIIGNATALMQSESYRKLINKIKDKNAYFEIDELK